MKKLVTIVFLVLTVITAQAQDGLRLTISHEGTVKEVLDILCERMEGSLIVRNSDVDLSRKVSIDLKDASAEDILNALFEGSDIKWSLRGKQVQIYRPAAAQAGSAAGKERTVSGVLKDVNGEPLVGAAVMLAGTKLATLSDTDGFWTLTVPQSSGSLVVICLGFEDTEIKLTEA